MLAGGSFVSVLKQVFSSFSVTNGKKKEKRKESAKINKKNMHKSQRNDFDQQTACGEPVCRAKKQQPIIKKCFTIKNMN